MKRILLLTALTLPVTSLGDGPAVAQGQGRALGRVEVTKGPNRLKGRKIPNRYIVTLEPKANPRQVAAESGIEPDFVYTQVLTGFAGTMSELAHAKLRRDNRVVRIEQDAEMVMSQSAKSWGLDRIDQRSLPLNGSYAPSGTGSGVTANILDTGIRFSHAMFAGRAIRGIDVINNGRSGDDCNGHGTHVAGTVGGGYGYGVARYDAGFGPRAQLPGIGMKITSASNTGGFSDRVPRGTYRYKVCNAGSTWCSAELAVTV